MAPCKPEAFCLNTDLCHISIPTIQIEPQTSCASHHAFVMPSFPPRIVWIPTQGMFTYRTVSDMIDGP